MPHPQPTVDLAGFFRSLANEKRFQILFTVFADKQEHTVGEIADALGMAVSTISEHLALLKQAGVLTSEKRMKQVFYRVDERNMQTVINSIQQWLDCC